MKHSLFASALFLVSVCPIAVHADPLKLMTGLEGDIPNFGEQEGGVRLTAPLTLKNTSDQFIAIALIPPFPKVSASNGATYFMRDAGGVTRCRNNNPIMGPACMGKPFTQGITIPPGSYTVIEPGTTANFDFVMEVERGGGSGGTYATFSALFAVRTFSSVEEDSARSDSDNYKRTRTLNIGIPERRITPQGSR